MENNNNVTPQEEFDIKTILKIARKYLWLFIALPIFCAIIAVIYSKTKAPEFTSTAEILVNLESANQKFDMLNFDGSMSSLFGSGNDLNDEIAIIKSKRLLTQLVNELDLRSDTYIKKGVSYRLLYQNEPLIVIYPQDFFKNLRGGLTIDAKKSDDGEFLFNFIYREGKEKHKFDYKTTSLDEPVETPWGSFLFAEQVKFAPKDEGYKVRMTAAGIKSRVSALDAQINISRLSKESNILTFSTTSQSQVRNEAIINKLIDIYQNDKITDQNQVSKQMSDFITERLALLTDELKNVEKQVEVYRKQHNMTDVSAQTQVYIQKAGDYEKQIANAEIQLSVVNFIENYLKKSSDTDLIPAMAEVSDAGFATMISQYNELVLGYIRLINAGSANTPNALRTQSQIQTTRTGILQSIENLKRSVEITKSDLSKKSSEFSSKIKDVPTYEREFAEIARQQQIKEQLFLFLLQKREEAQLSLAMATSSAKIVDTAYTQGNPAAMGLSKLALFALIIGLVLAALIVYLIEFFNDKISSKDELQRYSSLPIIGVLPFQKGISTLAITEDGHHSILKESIRKVRTYLPFIVQNNENKVIMVTSSCPGEGKSFVSINLALSLAMINKKVALVGLDVRKPMLGKYMNLSPKNGVTNFISDETIKVSDIENIYPDNKNLSVFTGGTVPPNPSELLCNSRLADLFVELRERFDYIIVDTPPVMFPDSYIVSNEASAIIYVVRKDLATRDDIRSLNTDINDNKLKNVYLLLNNADKQSYTYYYNRYDLYK
ncbi:MAG: polysaccharide biosynthesis tyrosine autokinase [Prevotellaceae bacterium]|jgi:capsular exopolysaccharide synthesis family protein|nr:polysaccharide biosynthesis tyrosine autokinase [Prevotellaceae bacterium]